MGDWFTWHLTYFFTWAVSAWFVYEMNQWLSPKLRHWVSLHWLPLLGLTLICGVIHFSEPHFHKVLADEPTHAAIALSMHLHKLVTMPFMMHLPYDVATWDYYSAPFRGHYFSFIVSVLHDVTGFRPNNVYIANGFIGWCTLIIVYALGQKLTGRRGLSFAVAASLAAAPIFGQVMCSGSYDMTNLMFLSLLGYFVICMAMRGFASQQDFRLILISSVLLSYSRPEGIVYYGYVVAVALICAPRWSEIITDSRLLPWEQVLGPLLFIPAVCTQLVLVSNRFNLTQGHLGAGEPMLSVDHAIRHWIETGAYFLNATGMCMSNVVFFVVGVFALGLLFVRFLRVFKNGDDLGPLRNVMISSMLLFCIILGLYTMIMCSFWGGATNAIMTRFTLPLWLMFAVACFLIVAIVQKIKPLTLLKWSPHLAISYFLLFTVPSHSSGESIKSMPLGYENDKVLDWIDTTDDKRTLFIGESAVQFIARKHSAVNMGVVSSHIPDYIRLVKSGVLGRLVLVEFQITDPRDGKSIIHDKSWRNTASEWKYKRLWSHQSTIGMQIVAEELVGVNFKGRYYDLTVKEEGLPQASTFEEMQQRVMNMFPSPSE